MPPCSSLNLEEDPRAARVCATLALLELYSEAGRREDKPGSPLDYQGIASPSTYYRYKNNFSTRFRLEDVAIVLNSQVRCIGRILTMALVLKRSV